MSAEEEAPPVVELLDEEEKQDPERYLPKDVTPDPNKPKVILTIKDPGHVIKGCFPIYEGRVKIEVDGTEKEIVVGEWDERWEAGVRAMRKGEEGTITSEGESVHIKVTDIQNLPEPYEIEVEQKIAFANERRLQGNSFYAQKDFTNAIKKYESSLKYSDQKFGLGMQEQADLKACSEPTFTNLAAVYLHLQNYHLAITHLTAAIENNKSCTTALIRRAKAYIGTYDFELAECDLSQISDEVLASNENVAAQVAEVRESLKKARAQGEKQDKQTYSKMFK
eukprot:TRINITY_DN13138_c1_g2_i1.p1 TRINITY_DN13138_c1_g2~~TRINITY_DN13138_c1_g2_i1.p1  ORF type:complete len:306 (+),score=77.25 TRINITY_DN13138_c1_g2_i1:80-919(+)